LKHIKKVSSFVVRAYENKFFKIISFQLKIFQFFLLVCLKSAEVSVSRTTPEDPSVNGAVRMFLLNFKIKATKF